MKQIRIPEDRIGVLIGKEGEVMEQIKDRTGIELDVDSRSGEIFMDTEEAEDPVAQLNVEEMITAIGRGFSPDKAQQLLRDDMHLEILNVKDYVGKDSKHVRRIKGRIIGQKGRTKKTIEDLTGSDLSIYRSTVSIISELYNMEASRTAVDMILSGSRHATVYRYLEKKKREEKRAQLESIMFSGGEDEEEADVEPAAEQGGDRTGSEE